jgi:hypothetical protein
MLDQLQLDETPCNFIPTTFFDSINRGGLSRPSEYCFSATVNCWRVFEDLRSSADLKDKLLGAENQQTLFVKVVERAVENGNLFIADNYCNKGHNLKEQISRRFFNCVAKNLARDLTAQANRQSDKSAKKRKIAKLTSKLNSST